MFPGAGLGDHRTEREVAEAGGVLHGHAEHGQAGGLDVRPAVAQALGLDGAAGRVVLGVEVDQDLLAEQRRQRDRRAVLQDQRHGRGGVADLQRRSGVRRGGCDDRRGRLRSVGVDGGRRAAGDGGEQGNRGDQAGHSASRCAEYALEGGTANRERARPRRMAVTQPSGPRGPTRRR